MKLRLEDELKFSERRPKAKKISLQKSNKILSRLYGYQEKYNINRDKKQRQVEEERLIESSYRPRLCKGSRRINEAKSRTPIKDR